MSAAPEPFWSLKLSDIINFAILAATIFAIYFGPIRAVEISRQNDIIREAERRKREIFATLMRTRRAVINPDHVWALNLIQLEFEDSSNIQRAYRDYVANLSETIPSGPEAVDAMLQRRRDLFFDLLHEIARDLGFSLDKRDLDRAAYVPVGWTNDEDEIRVFRRAMLDLLHGKRALPITPFQPTVENPYPPPPNASS